jgi:HTH-type transcriptional repressor of NAD biosynthesis genes
MTAGVIHGAFAPLRRKHQRVIETALRDVDRVIVAIHPADNTIPLSVRANWIRTLHPAVEVIEAWEWPRTDATAQQQYVEQVLPGCAVTRWYDAESGDDDAEALDPLVHRDLVTRVVFVGAPSTGKTTLAERLAKQYGTVWMPEYGREYWERYQVGRRLTLEQLFEIGEGHRLREDELAARANDFLFVDTEAIVTRVFSRHYHAAVDPRLDAMADESATRYDVFFFCDADFPYDDTPERSGEANRELFQLLIRDELTRRKIPFLTVRGSIEERMSRVNEVLGGYRKFTSLAEHLAPRR